MIKQFCDICESEVTHNWIGEGVVDEEQAVNGKHSKTLKIRIDLTGVEHLCERCFGQVMGSYGTRPKSIAYKSNG